MDAPTHEEKEKILGWLSVGLTQETKKFFKSLDEIRWRYLDEAGLNQQPKIENPNNEIEHQNQNPSADLNEPEKVETNAGKKIMKPKKRKRIHPSKEGHRQSHSKKGDDDVLNEKKKSKKRRGPKTLKVSLAKKCKSKEQVLIHKEPQQGSSKSISKTVLNPVENLVDSNAQGESQLLPAVVYVNPDLGKVKLETDYVPVVAIKSEPGTENVEEAVIAVEVEPKLIIKTEKKSHSEEISFQERAFQTDKILTTIHSHISTKDLLFNCSLVSKQWNKISRRLLQQDRKVCALIDQVNPCWDLLNLNKIIEASSTHSLTVPYNGIRFYENTEVPSTIHKNCPYWNSVENDGVENFAIFSCLHIKYLHLNGTLLTTSNKSCLVFNIISKILEIQGANLLEIKLQPFVSTLKEDSGSGSDSDSEYETCIRKFSDYFPFLKDQNHFLTNVKEIEIVQKSAYDTKSAYFENLQSQLDDLLGFTPNLHCQNTS